MLSAPLPLRLWQKPTPCHLFWVLKYLYQSARHHATTTPASATHKGRRRVQTSSAPAVVPLHLSQRTPPPRSTPTFQQLARACRWGRRLVEASIWQDGGRRCHTSGEQGLVLVRINLTRFWLCCVKLCATERKKNEGLVGLQCESFFELRFTTWSLTEICNMLANDRDLIRSFIIFYFRTGSDGDLTCMSADRYVN